MSSFLRGFLRYILTRVGAVVLVAALVIHFSVGFGGIAEVAVPNGTDDTGPLDDDVDEVESTDEGDSSTPTSDADGDEQDSEQNTPSDGDTTGGGDTESPDGPEFTVAVRNPEGGENITPEVRRTIQYWERNNARYDSAYEADFTLRPNASNPDVVVDFTGKTTCGGGYSGCAPRPDSAEQARQIEKPMVVQIDRTEVRNHREAYGTLRHEFGHILSVSHCDPPHYIMGCDSSAEYEEANWKERRYPFNDSSLTVYVDTDGASRSMADAAHRSVDRAAADDGVPSELTLSRVDDPWEADIVVRVVECDNCRGEYKAQFRGGQSYDSDGNMEYLSRAVITVKADNTDDVESLIEEGLPQFLGRR